MAAPTPPTTNVKYLPRLDDTEQRLSYKILATLTAGLGLAGVDVVTDATVHSNASPGWLILHAIEDTVIGAVTRKNATGSLSGKTLKAGDRIYGEITAVQLTSGSVELYRAPLG